MFFCLIALVILCVFGIRFSANHEDYLSKEQTGSIKGIFAVIIFLSHLRQYIEPRMPMDNVAVLVLNLLGQLMVAVFFFYSGYGILSAYSSKKNYKNNFFKGRILKTLLHFDIAVACYLILSLILGTKYTLPEYLLSWIGWTSLGNSNWFIFVILALYFLTWCAFLITGQRFGNKNGLVAAACVTVLSLGLWVFLYLQGQSSYWYNTLLCYPFGMWFSVLKTRFDQCIRKQVFWVIAAIASFGAFIMLYRIAHVVAYSLCACIFCLVITIMTARVKVDNPVLRWLGKYSFAIYIFQRLPMIILAELGLTENNVLFILISLAATLVLAVFFGRIFDRLDSLLFRKKAIKSYK